MKLKDFFARACEAREASVKGMLFHQKKYSMTGTDLFYLSASKANVEPPMFKVTGKLVSMNLTSATSVASRRRKDQPVDEYSTNMELSESDARTFENCFDALFMKLRRTDALPVLALKEGMIPRMSDFAALEERVTIRVANYSTEHKKLYFSRKVASRKTVQVSESIEEQEGVTEEWRQAFEKFPQIGPEFPELHIPDGYQLNPMVPVFNEKLEEVDQASLSLPLLGTVFFEVIQQAHNFMGTLVVEGRKVSKPIKQITLKPAIALCVNTTTTKDPDEDEKVLRKFKKRKLSFI